MAGVQVSLTVVQPTDCELLLLSFAGYFVYPAVVASHYGCVPEESFTTIRIQHSSTTKENRMKTTRD